MMAEPLGAEATDEAMSRALARWDTIGGYDDPAGWVYRVGLNWARSWLRRRRHHTDEVLDPAERPAPVDDRVDVSAAPAGLDVAHRSVVVLRHLLGYSTAETAEVLGIAEGTVKSRPALRVDDDRGCPRHRGTPPGWDRMEGRALGRPPQRPERRPRAVPLGGRRPLVPGHRSLRDDTGPRRHRRRPLGNVRGHDRRCAGLARRTRHDGRRGDASGVAAEVFAANDRLFVVVTEAAPAVAAFERTMDQVQQLAFDRFGTTDIGVTENSDGTVTLSVGEEPELLFSGAPEELGLDTEEVRQLVGFQGLEGAETEPTRRLFVRDGGWVERPMPAGYVVNESEIGVVVVDDETTRFTDDGMTWTNVDLPTPAQGEISEITEHRGEFLAVAAGGVIRASRPEVPTRP